MDVFLGYLHLFNQLPWRQRDTGGYSINSLVGAGQSAFHQSLFTDCPYMTQYGFTGWKDDTGTVLLMKMIVVRLFGPSWGRKAMYGGQAGESFV